MVGQLQTNYTLDRGGCHFTHEHTYAWGRTPSPDFGRWTGTLQTHHQSNAGGLVGWRRRQRFAAADLFNCGGAFLPFSNATGPGVVSGLLMVAVAHCALLNFPLRT